MIGVAKLKRAGGAVAVVVGVSLAGACMAACGTSDAIVPASQLPGHAPAPAAVVTTATQPAAATVPTTAGVPATAQPTTATVPTTATGTVPPSALAAIDAGLGQLNTTIAEITQDLANPQGSNSLGGN